MGTNREMTFFQLLTSKEVKREVKRKPELPPVSEMVIESIMALKDPPRKGSTLRAIKETIGLNWPVKEASLFYLLGLTATNVLLILWSTMELASYSKLCSWQ